MGCGCGSDEKPEEKKPEEKKPEETKPEENEEQQNRGGRQPNSTPPPPANFDEFDENTVEPLPQPTADFQNGVYHPSDDEEITTYFEACSPGLLYRIIKGNTWSFYNASRVYEMHIQFTFSASSAIEALGETKISHDENGDIVADAVCYPNQMIQYIRGSMDMLTSKIKALPLSEEFLQRKAAENGQIINSEMQEMQIPPDVSDEEALRQCVERNVMFVDRKFPPTQNSISKGSRKAMKTVPWARPSMYLQPDLLPHTRIFRERPNPLHVSQSVLGDSWIISALAAVTVQPAFIRSCFYHPHDPRLTRKENAHGGYRVTLNTSGWWQNVVVDDYFPVIGTLVKYAKSSTDVTELWISLIEKAYAKIHLSYAQIVAGDPLMLIQDVTGFPTSRFDEVFNNTENPGESIAFANRLENNIRKQNLVIVHTPCRDRSRPEHDRERESIYNEAGLVMGHAYVVRKVVPLEDRGVETALLQICNPWSKGVRWPGDWREGSSRWEENVTASQNCNRGVERDGNFWVSWEEAQRYFSGCGIAFTRPNCFDYRIQGRFQNQIPSVCLKIDVQASTTATLVLSMGDHRGTSKGDEDYAPILLSLGQGNGELHSVKITDNTHLDVEQPSKLFSFIQSRDVAMTVTLEPEHSPYFVVPRIMAEGASSNYVIGMLTESRLDAAISVSFVGLPNDSKAFTNFPVFDATPARSVSATYQIRSPEREYPKEFTHSEMTESGRGGRGAGRGGNDDMSPQEAQPELDGQQQQGQLE